MESFPLFPLQAQRPVGTAAVYKKRGRQQRKVVAISSHPAWRDLHDDKSTEGDMAADSVDLMRVFHEVLDRVRRGAVLNMDAESMTTEHMVDQVWRRLTMEDVPVRLNDMLRGIRSERSVICLFLALLELVRMQAISLRQDRSAGEILLKRNAELKCRI